MYLPSDSVPCHVPALSFMQLGALAVCIWQTNIMLMLFVACGGLIDILLVNRQSVRIQNFNKPISENDQVIPKDEFAAKPGVRRRKMKSTQDDPSPVVIDGNESAISRSHLSGLLDEVQHIIVQAWHLKWELVVSFSPFVWVLGAFGAFVYWNGSVVLGAKEAHSVSPHFAQIMYSVHFYSIAHPYLLADNRHYPFYIWGKVINAHRFKKYLLVLFYAYSWLSILHILGKVRSRIWVLAYFIACAAALVPAPLVEFRYYTIPFFVFMLNCDIDDVSKWCLVSILYVAVNTFTMYMFLFRPFEWSHESGVQRFIW